MRFHAFLRHISVLAVALLLALPASAVVPGKDFQTTLGSLLEELRLSYASAMESDSLLKACKRFSNASKNSFLFITVPPR